MKLLLENWKQYLVEENAEKAFDDITDAVEDASKGDEEQAEEFVDSIEGLKDIILQLEKENEELAKRLEDYEMESQRLKGDLSTRSEETVTLREDK